MVSVDLKKGDALIVQNKLYVAELHCGINQTHFQIKGFPGRLVLKQKHKVTGK